MKKLLTIAILAAMAITSCQTQQAIDINGEWNVLKVNDKSVSIPNGEQPAPFFGFNTGDKSVYGSLGCNRLTGTLNMDEKAQTIDFGATGTTRMMCPDMTTENLILGALPQVKAYKAKGTGLLLLDDKGNTVIELKKKEAAKQ